MVPRLAIALVLFFALLAGAQVPLQMKPGQVAEVPAFSPAIAEQKCKNWAWAAALETVLRLQGVTLGQRELVTRQQGGEVCDDDFNRFEELPKLVEGEYAREDGSKVRVSASFHAGAPTNVDLLIDSMRRGRPLVLFWKGHAYLLCAVIYDEYIAPSGQRIFEVRQMELRDPYVAAGDERFVTFVKGTDDTSDIDGLMQVSVRPVEEQSWKR
jgi:hypothetical protein